MSTVLCFFTKWLPFKNYQKHFLFHLKNFLCSQDFQFFVILSFPFHTSRFKRTNESGITQKWSNGLAVKALDSQGSRVQNHWAAPMSTRPFILLRSIKRVPGISGNLVVKHKLPPQSGSSHHALALRQLNHIHKKGL